MDIKNKIIEALQEYEGTDFVVTDELIEFIEAIEVEKPKILIEMDGGLIKKTIANVDMDVCIADYDGEDWDEEDINKVIPNSAWVSEGAVDQFAEKISEAFEQREGKDEQEEYVLNKLKEFNY